MNLRPETIEFLKGIGLTLRAGRSMSRNRHMGRARLYMRKSRDLFRLAKDMTEGEAHIPANIGGDQPRRRRRLPALTLARLQPND